MSVSFNPEVNVSYAYLRVRVPNDPRPDGSILVYLPSGTALVVNNDQLLHLDPRSDPELSPDESNIA
jgi:hypothetical protein